MATEAEGTWPYSQGQVAELREDVKDSPPYNQDLAPVRPQERTWGSYNLASSWIGMSAVISAYTLASGLLTAGMNWWPALLTVSLGNVLVPDAVKRASGNREDGRDAYRRGCNWWAIAAVLPAVAPVLRGFINFYTFAKLARPEAATTARPESAASILR